MSSANKLVARRAGEDSLHRKLCQQAGSTHERSKVTPREFHRKVGEVHRRNILHASSTNKLMVSYLAS